MTSNALTERTMETSISFKARIAGALYLISIVARMLVEIVVRNRLVVSGDSVTTATNIMGHESLFQYGFAGDIISFATYIALTALLYELFKPVNSSLSLIAAFFSLVACVLQAISSVFHLAPLLLLRGAAYLSAYTVGQLQALALLFLRVRFEAYHMGLIFLGLYCLFLGILILTSTFLPRFLGVLMVLGGLSYLPFLSPELARSLLPYLLIFPGVGQISLCLWLFVMGVNAPRWNERARTATTQWKT